MLVKRLAVELRKAMNVGRKMGRNPIEDHAKARRMRFIDEARETGGIAEAPGRREKPDRLIAPGGIERMFGYGKQLDMGETQARRHKG